MDYNEVLETKSWITKLIRIWRTWSEASVSESTDELIGIQVVGLLIERNISLPPAWKTMTAETSMIWRCKKSSLCVELFSWRLRDYVSIGIFADNTSFISSARLAWTCSGPRGPSWEKFRHFRVQVYELIVIEYTKPLYFTLDLAAVLVRCAETFFSIFIVVQGILGHPRRR